MIEVSEAEKIILNTPFKRRITTVPLGKSMGRILQENIFADVDFPPFNRVMMDGIAIRFSAFAKGRRTFSVENIQAAGSPQLSLNNPENCIEVMTGAILPAGTDTIIPYEHIQLDKEQKAALLVEEDEVMKEKNIHPKGSDKQAGEMIIGKGVKISAPEIALMASVGKTNVQVTQNPRIAIISTGNELVEIDRQPLPHQIRRSNVYALQAELNHLGLAADLYHINDERDVLVEELGKILDNHEVLMLSGGVSMGRYDFVPDVLQKLGVEQLFHKVKQKPGKPFWFGRKGEERAVFAFPGNPVSTFMCFHRYFIPWINRVLKNENPTREYAVLAEDFAFPSGLTYFLQVKTHFETDGRQIATPIKGKGSGDHANLIQADGFLELPAGRNEFKKGEAFRLFRYR